MNIPIETRWLYVECRDIQPLAEQYKITPLCDALQEMTAKALKAEYLCQLGSRTPPEWIENTPTDWFKLADEKLRNLEVQ